MSPPLALAGVVLVFVGLGIGLSAVVEVVDGGGDLVALVVSSLIAIAAGLLLWRFFSVGARLRPGTVFVSVLFGWLSASLAGALPFLLSGLLPTVDGALFESISGFTCTGSTVLTAEDFEAGSAGVMFWRQLTQWYGGMGMIVLAVAVLPFLGVGGLELIRAEAPGPTSDRLAPRVSETAKRLWLVYLGFTLVATVALLLAGMSLYDAVGHAFTVVSTGGFSPYAESIGFFDSVALEIVIIVMMVLGAVNFTLHWRVLASGPAPYWRSTELRSFLLILGGATAVVTILLVRGGMEVTDALRNGAFNVATLGTSTGYGNASGLNPGGDFVLWVSAAQIVLLALMLCGGMTGSTAGGMKVLRFTVLGRAAGRELLRARRPRAVVPVKEGDLAIPDRIVANIAGFGLLYFTITVTGIVLVALLGAELVTGAGGVVSAMGNMGPALGDAGPTSNFLVFSRPARLVLALLMLVGRLEVFPVMLTLLVVLRAGGRVRAGVRGRMTELPSPAAGE